MPTILLRKRSRNRPSIIGYFHSFSPQGDCPRRKAKRFEIIEEWPPLRIFCKSTMTGNGRRCCAGLLTILEKFTRKHESRRTPLFIARRK